MAGGTAFVAQSRGTARSFRADIQGLRAVAVVLVVINHAFGWPAGGFVGVDVFYVISGFLITGLLLRELDQTGSISLRAFYARRIRRILPVAVLVLVVTVLAAFVVWHTPRAMQTLLDAVSALFFVSNWHFIALGSDYLNAGSAVSPVQHYWSLSIEEQFYAVWPIALLVLFLVVRGSRRALLAVTLIVIVGSLGWAAWTTATDASAAYFDTFGRVWELLAGALIAVIGTAPQRIGIRLRHAISLIGIVLIVGSSVVVGASWGVPFPWVIPAVIGSALVIWAAAPAGRHSILGNRVSQWLGDISYSLYLWHFPVIIFAIAIFGQSAFVAICTIPVMLILSALSRRYVEQAVLDGSFLSKAARLKNLRPITWRDLAVGSGAFVAIVALSAAQLYGPVAIRTGSAFQSRVFGVEHLETSATATTAEERSVAVREALTATTWPESIVAQLDVLDSSQQPVAMRSSPTGCRNSVTQTAEPTFCGTPSEGGVMVIGDSVAVSWLPTVVTAGADLGWDVSGLGFASCSLIETSVTDSSGSSSFRNACAERREQMFEVIAKHKPDTVVLSASETVIGYTGLSFDQSVEAWQVGVTRTLERLADVPNVIVLTNPPLTSDPSECTTRLTGPTRCVSEITAAYAAKSIAEETAASTATNAAFIDTSDWFCADGECPAFIDGDVIKTDISHLTEASAVAVAPLFRAAVTG